MGSIPETFAKERGHCCRAIVHCPACQSGCVVFIDDSHEYVNEEIFQITMRKNVKRCNNIHIFCGIAEIVIAHELYIVCAAQFGCIVAGIPDSQFPVATTLCGLQCEKCGTIFRSSLPRLFVTNVKNKDLRHLRRLGCFWATHEGWSSKNCRPYAVLPMAIKSPTQKRGFTLELLEREP